MADLIDQQLGNYRMLRLIGEGGFADVYLGEHVHLGTKAAVKVLRFRANSAYVEQFRTEARIIARLVHPHIVHVLDFGVEQDIPFLVMDYAVGGSVRQCYPKRTDLPTASIVSYIKQVASALQYAHDQHFIHRDVKPENMLLMDENTLLLSDFGLVKFVQTSNAYSTQGFAGTAAYIAPEQIRGKPQAASDQYSLGAIVYEWLSGKFLFQGSPIEIYAQHLHATPPPLSAKIPGIPPAVERVVFTALDKDPSQRFARIEDFATALEYACQDIASNPRLPIVAVRPAFSLPVISGTLEKRQQPLRLPIPVQSQSQEIASYNLPQTYSIPQEVKRVRKKSRFMSIGLISMMLIIVLVSTAGFFFFTKNGFGTQKGTDLPKNAPLTMSSNPQSPPGITFTQSPAAISWGPDRIDLFGHGSDGAIYHSYWDGSWHRFESLGGKFIYGVAASSWGPGRLDLFAIGTDGALYHNYWDGSWHGWGERLGGIFTSMPAAVSSKSNHIDVFARGTDNAIWHTYWDGSWHGFDSLGGNFVTAPTVSSWGDGRLDVFAISADSGLYHNYWDGNWHTWGDRLSVPFISAPAAVSWGVNHIDVFARNSDNTIGRASWNGISWSPPETLGGNFTGSPTVTLWTTKRLYVFDIGAHNAIYHNYWDGTWHGWGDRVD